eukprot:SAG31_NODE_5433_length_2542_cov_1.498158_1_plen_564_part_10
MFKINDKGDWTSMWTSNPTSMAFYDADFSRRPDGQLVLASLPVSLDEVHLCDAISGTPITKVEFGTEAYNRPNNVGFHVRMRNDLLLVAGGNGLKKHENSCDVGVWRLDKLLSQEEKPFDPDGWVDRESGLPLKLRTLNLGCPVGPIDASETHLAVGVIDGAISLYEFSDFRRRPDGQLEFYEPELKKFWFKDTTSSDEIDEAIELQLPLKSDGNAKTETTCVTFTHDGTKLAASWSNGDVKVFDVNSCAVLARFYQEDLTGPADMLLLSFSLDDCTLVVGGGTCKTVSIHQIAPVFFERFRMEESFRHGKPVSDASVSEKYVAVVADNRVSVLGHSGQQSRKFEIETEAKVESIMGLGAVTLRPGGEHPEHIAMLIQNHKLVVYELGHLNCKNIFEKDFVDTIFLIRYSPDGKYLILVTVFKGVHIFDADSLDRESFLETESCAQCVNFAMGKVEQQPSFYFVNWGPAGVVRLPIEGIEKADAEKVDTSKGTYQFIVFEEEGRRLAYAHIGEDGISRTVFIQNVGRGGEGDQSKEIIPPQERLGSRCLQWSKRDQRQIFASS